MTAIAFEIGIIVVLLVINGVFAMSEIAVVTSKRVRLEHRAERGDRGAATALRLAEQPTQFLSTVQVGITLVGVLAGAFGGATIAEQLAASLERVAWLGDSSEGVAFAIVVAGITYLSLIIGELVPKRIALGNPERVAALVARPMSAIARVARPLVALLTGSTRLVLRLFGVKDVPEPGLSEEELHALVEQGAESGVVPEMEHAIVESVFRLGDLQVGSVMTARPDIEWLDIDTPEDDLRIQLTAQRRPWFLVCREHVEDIQGVVHASDLLASLLAGDRLDLRAVLGEPLYVPETTPALRVLETFRTSRQHVAVALDEFGGVAGLVTLEDIMAELVGEMPTGAASEPMISAVNGGWLAMGAAPIEDVADALELDDLEVDDHRGYRTLGGFVLARLGHVPITGEAVEWEGYHFEVAAMDGRRIDRVRIRRVPGES